MCNKHVVSRATTESVFDSQGMPMNYARIALASLGATVAYFVYGFVMLAAWPSMKTEFKKYPNVYRSEEGMMKVMPYGVVAILIGIVIFAILYAKTYPLTAASYLASTSAHSSAFSRSACSSATT